MCACVFVFVCMCVCMSKSKVSVCFVNPFDPFVCLSVFTEAVVSVSQQRWEQIIRVDLCCHLEVLAAAVAASHVQAKNEV